MIHRGIDGALVNLAREPLQAATLRKITEVRDATGWLPVSVGGWVRYKECFKCADVYSQWHGYCPSCAASLFNEIHMRHIYYWSWWRPWTWGRPSLEERKGRAPPVEREVLPEPRMGSTSGQLSLPASTDETPE